MSTVVPFPEERPPGYEWLADEPTFDPSRHLALESPESVTYLTDLGYAEDELGDISSPVAVSKPIRILSDEGAGVMLDVARRLRPFVKRAGSRIDGSSGAVAIAPAGSAISAPARTSPS